MAEQPEGSEAKKAEDGGGPAKPPESPWTALLKELGQKALTALFAVGGLAAFAAFAGSIVLWTRFDALQLPANQIVEVVPRAEAITTGTTILLLFGFCGVVAALASYLIDRGGRATPGMSRGVVAIVAAEAIMALWLTTGTDTLDRAIATEIVLLSFGAIVWATYVGGLVNLKRSDDEEIPDLLGDEDTQDFKPTAFRDRRDGWTGGLKKTAIACGVALGAGVRGWLIAFCVSGGEWGRGWFWGLATLGLALAAAVVIYWLHFVYAGSTGGRTKREGEDAERRADLGTQEKEETDRKEEQKQLEEDADRERRPARIAGVVAWLKATWERGERDRSLTISLGAPDADPVPPHRKKAAKKKSPGGSRSKPPAAELAPNGLVVIVPLALAAVVSPALILDERWLVITLAAIVFVGLGLWRIADLSSGAFIWYGVAVFLSVPLVATVALATRNIDDPQAQPVAIIRNGDGPAEALQGLYVTETDKRVYFANVATQGCEKKIVGDSGRLLWVPKDDVVAMAIGPEQDIDKAARASLEMAYALTPDIETSGGATISVSGEDGTGAAKAADGGDMKGEAEALGDRLLAADPAIRPKFGRGLRLEPEIASPGDRVKLFVSSPEYDGLRGLPKGRTLRLNGVKLPILHDKKAKEEDKIDMMERKVSLRELREEKLEFEVPGKATSGIVTVECTQLARQPYLAIPQKPKARIAVKMQAGSRGVRFDSSGSVNTAGKDMGLTRRWTVAGLRMGHETSLTVTLPPRLAPYHVRLDVTDSEGGEDHVDLRLLRLPQSRFPFGADRLVDTKPMNRVREALRSTRSTRSGKRARRRRTSRSTATPTRSTPTASTCASRCGGPAGCAASFSSCTATRKARRMRPVLRSPIGMASRCR